MFCFIDVAIDQQGRWDFHDGDMVLDDEEVLFGGGGCCWVSLSYVVDVKRGDTRGIEIKEVMAVVVIRFTNFEVYACQCCLTRVNVERSEFYILVHN